MSENVPFSFPIEAISLSPKGRDYKLTANADERAAIARALGLESLEQLSATVSVTPGAGGTFAVSGDFTADVVQACVVTLAPVRAHIAEPIARRFAAQAPATGTKAATEDEGWVDPDAEVIDPLVDGKLDLGEVVTEQLSLSLDPYPRAPGATFQGVEAGGSGTASGPFAALAALKAGKVSPRRGERGKAKPRSTSGAKRKT